jgi:hypothetical protein
MRTYDERTNNRQSDYDDRDEAPPRNGRPYRNGRRNNESAEQPRYQNAREASRPRVGQNMDLTEWSVAHEVRVQHIKVTIWLRQGRSERPIYSLTLTRTFRSQRGYLSTNKLFADDAPLAAEAFRLADEWLQQGAAASDAPPF